MDGWDWTGLDWILLRSLVHLEHLAVLKSYKCMGWIGWIRLDGLDWIGWILLRSLVQLEHLAVLINLAYYISNTIVTVGSRYGLSLRMKKLGSYSITFTNDGARKRKNWVSSSLGPIFKGNLKLKKISNCWIQLNQSLH